MQQIDHSTLFFAQPDQFITVKEAAYLVRKSSTTIRTWVALEHVAAIKVGGTLYIYRPSLFSRVHSA